MASTPGSTRSVLVFTGSRHGADPAYAEAARSLGAEIAGRGHRLVYGGGKVGLMGVVADAAMEAGGQVLGVIPGHLQTEEVAHPGLADLEVTESMHERKARMYELADAVVVLPGGLGTLDELFETLTWNQLGLHAVPVGILDAAGYWRPLIELLDRTAEAGFVDAEQVGALVVGDDPASLLDGLLSG